MILKFKLSEWALFACTVTLYYVYYCPLKYFSAAIQTASVRIVEDSGKDIQEVATASKCNNKKVTDNVVENVKAALKLNENSPPFM